MGGGRESEEKGDGRLNSSLAAAAAAAFSAFPLEEVEVEELESASSSAPIRLTDSFCIVRNMFRNHYSSKGSATAPGPAP